MTYDREQTPIHMEISHLAKQLSDIITKQLLESIGTSLTFAKHF